MRYSADFLFAADVSAVFLELLRRERRNVISALYEVVSVLAEHSLGQRIDMHYSRSLNVYYKIYGRVFLYCIESVFLRLFERYAADRIRHSHESELVDVFFGFLSNQLNVVAYEQRQTLVGGKYAHVPFVAYVSYDGVLSVGFYQRSV